MHKRSLKLVFFIMITFVSFAQLFAEGKLGLKVAFGLSVPAGSTLEIDNFDTDVKMKNGIGNAFHLSVFKKLSETIEINGGVELILFSGTSERIGEVNSNGFSIFKISGIYTLNLFVSGRYNLIKSKIFIEGAVGYYLHSLRLDVHTAYENSDPDGVWEYVFGSRHSSDKIGFRIGGGYVINKCFEIGVCAHLAGRNAIFIMIGHRI